MEPSRDADPVNTLIATEPVILEDLRAETRFGGLPLLSEHGVVSGVSVLIRGQERPFGVLGAYTTKQQTPSNEDVHFLQSIAYILTTTIEHKRAEK